MIFLILSSALSLPSLMGWGAGFCYLLEGNSFTKISEYRLTTFGIAGFFSLGMIASVGNLFFPLGYPFVNLSFLGIGWIFFIMFKSTIIPPPQKRTTPNGLNFIFLFFSYLLFHALLNYSSYDTGLYHLQSILWAKEHPVPFGLVHIHTRLAYNSIWFPMAAVLGLPNGLFLSSATGMNFLITFFFGIGCWEALDKVVSQFKPERSLSAFFLGSATGLLFTFIITEHISCSENDLPLLILTLLIFFNLIRSQELSNPHEARSARLWAFLLSIFAITIKTASIPLAIGTSVLTLPSLLSKKSRGHWWLCAPIILLVSWVVRSVMLSGCLVFPLASGCFPNQFPWGISQSAAQTALREIQYYARMETTNQTILSASHGAWILHWIKQASSLSPIRLLLSVIILSIGLSFRIYIRRSYFSLNEFNQKLRQTLPLFLILGFCLIAWFYQAPNLRFGQGFLITLTLLLFSLVFLGNDYDLEITPKLHKLPLNFTFWTFFFGIAISSPFLISSKSVLQFGLWPKLPEPSSLTREAISVPPGKTIYIRVKGDQCWHSELPCSPYHPELQLKWFQDPWRPQSFNFMPDKQVH